MTVTVLTNCPVIMKQKHSFIHAKDGNSDADDSAEEDDASGMPDYIANKMTSKGAKAI